VELEGESRARRRELERESAATESTAMSWLLMSTAHGHVNTATCFSSNRMRRNMTSLKTPLWVC